MITMSVLQEMELNCRLSLSTLGPQQILVERRVACGSISEAVRAEDALLCRVGSPLADELFPMFWRTGGVRKVGSRG